MKSNSALSFALQAGVLASILAIALVLALRPHGGSAIRFALAGWGIIALTGVAGGAWIARNHGRGIVAFLVALQSCMLARLALAAGGAFVSWKAGEDAIRFFLTGLAVGFLPLQTFEIVWFYRRTQRLRLAGAEPRDGAWDATQ